jgi:hypothetical protein
MYYNIAQRILEPTMGNNHELISTAAAQIQTNLNKQAGIGIKGIKAPLNKDRISGIVNKISAEDDFEKVKWMLDEPIINFSQSIVDDTAKANSEFHDKAGLVPKVTRTVVGGCCEWCAAKAGTYTAPNIPKDIYQRHRFCRCTIEYDPGDGKKRRIGDKERVAPDRGAKIEKRKTIGINNDKLTGDQRNRAFVAKQSGADAKIPPEIEGNFDDFKKLNLTEKEKDIFTKLYTKTIENNYEYGCVITQKGEVFEFGSKEYGRIKIPTDGINETGLKIFHSHTNDTPPSVADFARLLDPKVSEVGVVTRNQDVFKVSVGDGWIPTQQEFSEITKKIARDVNMSIQEEESFAKWTFSERNYMGTREQAYRIVMEFEWIMAGGKLNEK